MRERRRRDAAPKALNVARLIARRPALALKKAPRSRRMFQLPPLPFTESALEPLMSRDTLATHHGKHHAGYIKKTNAALEERANAPRRLEDVVRLAAREKDDKLFNNAAQAWNHGFFWQSLAPDGGGQPQGELARAIDQAFGSFDAFRDDAKSKGEGHFASGWLWLVANGQGKVSLTDLHDAQTPIVDPAVTPLFTCDLWEHAYYLDYKNERAKFLDAFFDKLVNWRFAESQYAAARKAGEGGWVFPA
jgi:Fe-Mn family superoxide dismutase